MREIKFRAWDKRIGRWRGHTLDKYERLAILNSPDFEVMQFTGLKDKNGLTYIYEGDIIGVDGLVKGNRYENRNLLQDRINLVIEGFGTKNWWSTYKEAVARGCKDAE